MRRRTLLKLGAAAGVATLVPFGGTLSVSAASLGAGRKPYRIDPKTRKKITASDRQAAAQRAAAKGLQPGVAVYAAAAPGPGGTPDYFGPYPNWALSSLPTLSGTTVSGGIRKFVDALPSLPIAVPDATTFPGSDYYEIELRQYSQKMHSDLPATTLRGYVQVKNGVDVAPIQYLGPVIVAQRDRPVRIKFTNKLPTGTAGDLLIPTDTTYMGAGMGPNGASYTENRATLHLHGGNNPWISDGTPHQWTIPVGETAADAKGLSTQYVPDMWFDPNTHALVAAGTPNAVNNPGPGSMTFYYTNQQSARLLFYHDHAYGITRLNVYVGEAAGYLIQDSVEQNLAKTVGFDGVGVPLVIQDKTFVDATTIAAQDPTWNAGSGTPDPLTGIRQPVSGDLWFPHVYMPNQNPGDISGANAMGRWDYGPWFWPPFTTIAYGQAPNPYYDPINAPWEPPNIPGVPSLSGTPESFMDTPLVNGMAYPTMTVDPTVQPIQRFRILNACNDRMLNLSLWVADSSTVYPTGYTGPGNSEVKMTPWNSSQNLLTPFPAWWYDSSVPNPFDDRVGGVPDPATRGPAMIQIGTEAGLLAAPAVILNQPVNYVMNKRDITVGNVKEKALFLGPAERADVLVDFSDFAGKTLILYNDAPAPVPAADSRLDYFTGDVDQTSMGGAPTTLPGYGPNTRTVMQIVVGGSGGAATPDFVNQNLLTTLGTALPAAFGASQHPPVVAQMAYNAAFGGNYPVDTYVRIQDTQVNVTDTNVNGVALSLPNNGGSGYIAAPVVTFTGGGGSGAAATAVLTPTPVATVALSLPNNGGSGYTSAPAVTFAGGGGSGAAATAAILLGGANYTSAPTVSIAPPPPGGTQATATATVSLGKVTGFTITNRGSGYSSTTPPKVTISNGGGSGAFAVATVSNGRVSGLTLTSPVVSLTRSSGGSGYTSVPTVAIAAPTTIGGVTATATATLTPTSVASLILTAGGSTYTSTPTVKIDPPTTAGGVQATATASVLPVTNVVTMGPRALQELFTLDYGRMNATIAAEIPSTNGLNQTTIPYAYIDPPIEIVTRSNPAYPIGSPQSGAYIWKVTHNGVDTHAIHFHLFDVQVVNRVGWDGAIRGPDDNEIGWKDTVRMNPLEDCIVALRPFGQTLPWDLPNSFRPMDVTMKVGTTGQFTDIDPLNNPAVVTNTTINFGYEYVWHCHLLGHEENDMMRPVVLAAAPVAPSNLASPTAGTLTWTDNSLNETSFTVQRASNVGGAPGAWSTLGTAPASAGAGGTVTYKNSGIKKGYWFRVIASNLVGYTQTYAAPAVGYPSLSVDSLPSNALLL